MDLQITGQGGAHENRSTRIIRSHSRPDASSGSGPGQSPSSDIFVLSGETLTVGAGESQGRTVVYPSATLIIDGGSITSAPAMDSVQIAAGGTCVMREGTTDYFLNNGRLEIYGGTAGPASSDNHGYMMLAGGDPGFQIVMGGGVLDIFSLNPSRTTLEIDGDLHTPADSIRLFTVTNSLGWGEFEVEDLDPLVVVYPPYAEFEMDATFWTPSGNVSTAITYLIPTNWNGRIFCEPFVVPASNEVDCAIGSAVALTWACVSNRGYQVQATTNLLTGSWENLGLPFYSTRGGNLFFDATDTDTRTYRAKILH